MKKYHYILAATLVSLASCSSDDFLGTNSGNDPSALKANEISFGGITGKISRADEAPAKTDAEKLTNRFWVYGVKHTNKTGDDSKTTDQMVYNNYLVKYTTSSTSNQDQSTSTTTGKWEYDKLNNSNDPDGSSESSTTYNYTTAIKDAYSTEQGIKYWDYSADQGYTFTAFSALPSDLTGNDPKIKIENSNDGYKITMKEGTSTDHLYFADKVDVESKDYNKTVKFTFRSVLAKVRVAMYSTIPGYNVKIDKFYSGTDQNTASTDKFTANVTNTPFSADGKTEYTITYDGSDKHAILKAPTSTSSDANNARTRGEDDSNSEGTGSSTSASASKTSTVIELGSNLTTTAGISDDKNNPTYDKKDEGYTCFLAQKDNTSAMNVKVDYTLTSKDGSKETIQVKGATVTVAADNLKWEVNHAYTYVFKLSQNTNGSTGGSSNPTGLFPITFEAVVAEEENNSSNNEFEFKNSDSGDNSGTQNEGE